MMERKKRCKHCQRLFSPRANIKDQKYCSNKDCQRARKRQWQRRQMATDLDYRTNQKEAKQNWQERNADYYQKYRKNHPEYVRRNRELQKARDQKRGDRLAKMDAYQAKNNLNPGVYKVVAVAGDLAKMDASKLYFYIIPVGYAGFEEILQERT
jgi:hypothetical protein